MTEENYKPGERFASGVKLDPAPVFVDGVAGAKLREAEALPKPAPSQAVGATLNVAPFPDPVQEMIDAAEIQARDLDEGRDDHLDDSRWGDTTTSVAEADDEQRAYLQRRIDKQHQHNRELIGSVARLEERLADATVRAYEPPDTLTGVVGAAVEGLVAVGKRWWRR